MRRSHRLWTVIAAILAVVTAAPVAAQDALTPLDHLPALAGDYFPIASEATGRTYHIYVRYPGGYDPADASRLYPTVYLTDGDSLFPMLAPTQLFLTYDEGLPEAVVVGIAYGAFDPAINRRDLDFIPPGAEAFGGFLAQELIPEIEARYRSNPSRRILVGQSRGGAYVIQSALSQPDLFWGRIASNPAFGPDEAWAYAEAAPAARDDLSLIVISGSRDRPNLRAGALRWFEAWQGRTPPWRLNTMTLEGGTHAASMGEAYRAGMLWLFAETARP